MTSDSGSLDLTIAGADLALDQIDLSDMEYWAGPCDLRLGANLARRGITMMFGEIHRSLPSLRITGQPSYLQNNFIHGIKRLDCAWD
jgi:hypothetical protein